MRLLLTSSGLTTPLLRGAFKRLLGKQGSAMRCRLAYTAKTLCELVKIKITTSVALTSTLGFLLARSSAPINILPAVIGTFLLACTSAALNQIQDAELDRRMERTRGRPLPSGRMTVGQASVLVVLLAAIGTALLLCCNTTAAALGLFTLLWYNLVYTYLKRVSAFAVIPGALTGALPPLIGWTAAGGAISDLRIISLCVFLFLWQIPHFWLLLLLYARDFARAGLPTLERMLSARQIARVTFVWIAGAAVSGMLLPLCGASSSSWFAPVYFLLAIVLMVRAAVVLRRGERYREVFVEVNLFVLAVVMALLFDGLAVQG